MRYIYVYVYVYGVMIQYTPSCKNDVPALVSLVGVSARYSRVLVSPWFPIGHDIIYIVQPETEKTKKNEHTMWTNKICLIPLYETKRNEARNTYVCLISFKFFGNIGLIF